MNRYHGISPLDCQFFIPSHFTTVHLDSRLYHQSNHHLSIGLSIIIPPITYILANQLINYKEAALEYARSSWPFIHTSLYSTFMTWLSFLPYSLPELSSFLKEYAESAAILLAFSMHLRNWLIGKVPSSAHVFYPLEDKLYSTEDCKTYTFKMNTFPSEFIHSKIHFVLIWIAWIIYGIILGCVT